MSGEKKAPRTDRRQLQQIIAGLSEGVLLFDTDGNIDWANPAGLAAYGVETLADLGQNEAAYFERFNLHYRNHHELKARAISPSHGCWRAEEFSDLIVEVTLRRRRPKPPSASTACAA